MTERLDTEDSGVWRVLYRVAETAATARDLPAFYRAVHAIVGELMNATNLFIALYDDERQRICWPYYVDEFDTDVPDRICGSRSASETRAETLPTCCGRESRSC